MTNYETRFAEIPGGVIESAQIEIEASRDRVAAAHQSLESEGSGTDPLWSKLEDLDGELGEIESALKRELKDRETLRKHGDGVALTQLTRDCDGDDRLYVTLVYEPNTGSLQTVEGRLTTARTSPRKAVVTNGEDDYSVYGSGWDTPNGTVNKNGTKIGEYVTTVVEDR